MVVTSVENGGVTADGRDRYLCSVADRNGVPVKVRIWRGCRGTTRPGDAPAVVYDPKGRIPPRGVEPQAGVSGPLRGLAGWAVALVAGSTAAVVRSYRLSSPSGARKVPGRGGTAQS